MTAPESREPPKHALGRVLLVDDNASIRAMVALFLRQLGYRAVEAATGEDAVVLVGGSAFELILMDLNLPGADGLEAARRIRRLPGAAARVPIIGMTAADHQRRRPSCLEAGMNEVVDKVGLLTVLPDLLRRFAGGGGAVAGPDAVSQSSPAVAAPPAVVAALGDAALRLGELDIRLGFVGRPAMARMFEGFLAQGGRQLAELMEACRTGRHGDAIVLAHRLSGAAATFQMIGLHALLTELENGLRYGVADQRALAPLIERLGVAWPQAVAAFERWLASAA